MPHKPDTTDDLDWQRYFAIQANNRAWELASQPSRTEAEAIEMLNQAHASALHWEAVGTELNVARASYLVAEAHALAGSKALSMSLVARTLEYFRSGETDDWELAYIYVIHAHALAGSLESEEFAASYIRAKTAVASISDPEEKKIVTQTFSQVPVPKKRTRGK